MHVSGSNALSNTAKICMISGIIVLITVGVYFSTPFWITAPSGVDNISVAALSLNPSSSNLSATVNLKSHSQFVRLDVYMNNTFVGSCNYTGDERVNGMTVMMTTVSSGAYTMRFSFTSAAMPMMSNMGMMNDRTYAVRMVAMFQDGTNCSVVSNVHVGQNGMSSMMS